MRRYSPLALATLAMLLAMPTKKKMTTIFILFSKATVTFYATWCICIGCFQRHCQQWQPVKSVPSAHLAQSRGGRSGDKETGTRASFMTSLAPLFKGLATLKGVAHQARLLASRIGQP